MRLYGKNHAWQKESCLKTSGDAAIFSIDRAYERKSPIQNLKLDDSAGDQP